MNQYAWLRQNYRGNYSTVTCKIQSELEKTAKTAKRRAITTTVRARAKDKQLTRSPFLSGRYQITSHVTVEQQNVEQ